MPGDRFTLPVRIRRQKDCIGIAGRPLELLDDPLLAGDAAVIRFEAVVEINAHLFLRQIF